MYVCSLFCSGTYPWASRPSWLASPRPPSRPMLGRRRHGCGTNTKMLVMMICITHGLHLACAWPRRHLAELSMKVISDYCVEKGGFAGKTYTDARMPMDKQGT